MVIKYLLVTCVLWATVDRLNSFSNYEDYLDGANKRVTYRISNSFDIIPYSQKILSDDAIQNTQSCVDRYLDQHGDVHSGDIASQIESYLKNYLNCALDAFYPSSYQPLCKSNGGVCTVMTNFDDKFKSHPELSKYRFGVVLRDMEVTDDRLNPRVLPNDEDSSGCRQDHGSFTRTITETHTVDVQLDKSNKVTFGNGLDVDVSWSVGFLGIVDIGQSYSGSYMVHDSDSTATSEKTTESVMKKVEIQMSWDKTPNKVQTKIYRKNTFGKRKFIAWMEVQGWLARYASIRGPGAGGYGESELTLIPIGDFAPYHEYLGVKRLGSHSFMFPIVGYIENNSTEYVFELKEVEQCQM